MLNKVTLNLFMIQANIYNCHIHYFLFEYKMLFYTGHICMIKLTFFDRTMKYWARLVSFPLLYHLYDEHHVMSILIWPPEGARKRPRQTQPWNSKQCMSVQLETMSNRLMIGRSQVHCSIWVRVFLHTLYTKTRQFGSKKIKQKNIHDQILTKLYFKLEKTTYIVDYFD